MTSIIWGLGFLFPLTFLALLQLAPPSKPDLQTTEPACTRQLRSTQFPSQLSPRQRRNLCSLPGSCRAAETPSLPHPLPGVSQPSCDCSAACLCLQQSTSSHCQVTSLLKSYLSSSSCHQAAAGLLHCLLTCCTSTNSSAPRF